MSIGASFATRELRLLSPENLQRLLNSDEGIRNIPAEVRRRALDELSSLRHALLRRTCSQPWFSHCWGSGDHYPPDADTTAMVACQCDHCLRLGKLWPSHYVLMHATADGVQVMSYECYLESLSPWEAAHLPSSPSGLALRAIREGRIKIRRQRTRLGATRRRVV